jgi:hypothetical protein
MKKAFLTGVALVAMIMAIKADELEDKIKAQKEADRIERILKTSQACAMADSYQRIADQYVRMIAALNLSPNSSSANEARNRQNTADGYRAQCNAALGR